MRILLLAPLALLSCATSADTASLTKRDQAELDRALAGRVAGKPQRCINPRDLDGGQAVNPRNLVYRQTARRIWRNELPSDCPQLRMTGIPVFRIYGAQICAGDAFEVVDRDSGMTFGGCQLGDFVPYDKPRTPKAKPAS